MLRSLGAFIFSAGLSLAAKSLRRPLDTSSTLLHSLFRGCNCRLILLLLSGCLDLIGRRSFVTPIAVALAADACVVFSLVFFIEVSVIGLFRRQSPLLGLAFARLISLKAADYQVNTAKLAYPQSCKTRR